MNPHWYFAYGSNMQGATFRGRRGMQPLESRAGLLRGYRLCFDIPIGAGRRGVANLAIEEAASVWGVLHLLNPEQHELLDRTEGVPGGLYRRIVVEVETASGVIAAETYISEIRDAARLPSHRYRGLLLEGAREHGLPADYVDVLEALELAWDEREGAVNPPGLSKR